MALFDKLGEMAKNLGDKTSDAIETGKLNSKINAEKAAAAEDLKKIGEHYYNLFAASGEAAPEILEFCQSAKAHYDAAAEAQAEIERIKAENEAEKTAAVPAPAASADAVCPSCGKQNTPGTKFCQNCGMKLEAPAPAASADAVCPSCGTANGAGTKFCQNCGTKLEAPAPVQPQERICAAALPSLPA